MLTRDVTESDLTTFNLERRKSRQFSRNRTFPPWTNEKVIFPTFQCRGTVNSPGEKIMYEGERVISWSLHFVSSHCFSCGSCRQYEDDDQVLADNELQEFANELSADGTHGDFAGLGKVTNMLWHFMQKRDLYFWASLEKRDFFLQTTIMVFRSVLNYHQFGSVEHFLLPSLFSLKVKKFPASIKTKAALRKVLTTLFWAFTGGHAASTYPILEYGGFVPNAPHRLFADSNGNTEFSNLMFGNKAIALVIIDFG